MPSNTLGSRNVISRKHYEEFVYPYDKKMVGSFKESGIPTILHICGNAGDRLSIIADTGYDGVSIDSLVNLEQAKRDDGDRICLIGNVDVL